jgi:hypothetical protein
MRDRRGLYRVLVERPAGNIPMERTELDERIILKWIFKERDGQVWTELIWLRIEAGGGCL